PPRYCAFAGTPVQLVAFFTEKRRGGPPGLAATLVLSNESRVMQTIARYLDILRATVDGDELHGLISRILRRHSQPGPPGLACLVDLFQQLDRYARDPVSAPRMRIRARLLQQHIAPYLTEAERPAGARAASDAGAEVVGATRA